MADDASNTPEPFDVGTIKSLVRLMSLHDLSEIDLRQGEQRIRLRRGTRLRAAPPLAHVPTPAPAPAPPNPTPPPAEAPAKKHHEIRSPAVGTFYAQKEPGSPPYVTVGSRVTPDTVVCQIEAMKLFNEITADCSGVIVEVVAQNKQFVEYDTVLFRVDLTG